MARLALLVYLAIGAGCSLIVSSDPSSGVDEVDAAQPPDGSAPGELENFESGLGQWVAFGNDSGDCLLAPDPSEPSNQVVCCQAGEQSSRGIIQLDLPATNRVEVSFRLRLEGFPGGSAPMVFSPAAGVNNLPSVGEAVIANMNVYPDGTFAAASARGAPGTNLNYRPIPSEEWVDVTFEVSTEVGCGMTQATITGPEISGLVFTQPITSEIRHVVLGVFRQAMGAGTSARCFDDVSVRSLSGCD